MSPLTKVLHWRILGRPSLGWLACLGVLLFANWVESGRLDHLVESLLVGQAAWLALTVHWSTPRECMEYLGQLPVKRSEVAALPYKAALLQLCATATIAHLIESTGAVWVVARFFVDTSLYREIEFHRRPLGLWLNLYGYPFLTFHLAVALLHRWRPRLSPASFRVLPWTIGLALALPVAMLPMSSLRHAPIQPAYSSNMLQALPGAFCLLLGLCLHHRSMSRIAARGFEAYAPGNASWES